MNYLSKFIIFAYILAACLFISGCSDKTLKPAAVLEVPTVSPFELYATATNTQSLPTADITITSLSKIPCNLRKYSVKYFTPYGEEIPQLAINSIPVESKLAAEGEITVTTKPYTSKVVDLYELSTSDISPITAQITVTFEDYNGNWVERTGHCQLYKPGS